MFFLAKYGVETVIRFPVVKRGVVDLAATADWTPATGDTKVSKNGGDFANSNANPAAVGGTGSIGWTVTLSATELTCAELNLQIVDSATKAVEDQFLVVYTYGHASAKIVADLSDAVRLGLTSLPNAAADAAGGLPISDAGGLDLDAQVKTAIDAILVDTGTTLPGRIPAALTGAGNMKADALAVDGSTAAATNLKQSATVIYVGSVTGAATTTTLIDSGLTEAGADHWKGRIVIFLTGALKYQATDITAFDPALDKLTFTALTAAPGGGDTFVIV